VNARGEVSQTCSFPDINQQGIPVWFADKGTGEQGNMKYANNLPVRGLYFRFSNI
jgi:hypothetical protein